MQQQMQPQFTFEGGHLVMFHQEATGLTKDATVNDRDRMQDLLAQEKYLTTGYSISMNEASHEALFQVLKQNNDSCHQLQRQVFQTMFKKGWYRLAVADAASVSQAHQQFSQYRSQLPSQSKSGSPASGGTQQTTMQAGGKTQGEQQLNQRVEQAIRQAEQGRVPSAQAPSRTQH